ncbi:MAG: APC family permease, partial [Lentisphaeraceae bacterium]|nr:APC family permease [Lentisphaeraceae bacterium]
MSTDSKSLKREVGLPGAIMMGLGSILGTGVFVSFAIGAKISGPAVIIAIIIAALIAMCNAFSSAQLAAVHPVSGGTYEYGYKFLNSKFGFTAGWMFLCAKSASAATAALGFAGYLSYAFKLDAKYLVPIALATILLMTLVVLKGIKRSNSINILIVSLTLATLLFFALSALVSGNPNSANLQPIFPEGKDGFIRFLETIALMFVAYTGYGRIATLGEEVKEPRKTIPKAIVATLSISAALYALVSITAISTVGSAVLADSITGNAAPLEVASQNFKWTITPIIVSIGAMTAMLGVLLNLILGLSRTLLAMGRREDMPKIFGKLSDKDSNPANAVLGVYVIISGLALLGSVSTTWSFSAFTVLIYYSITNLAALKLSPEQRIYPKFFSVAGLLACFFLAFWVQQEIWLTGCG